MGCASSQPLYLPPPPRCQLRLEITDAKGRSRSCPGTMSRICRGQATRPTVAQKMQVTSSTLSLTRAVLYRENRDAFTRGMEQHGWIQLTELRLCRCGINHQDLETILSSLQAGHHFGLRRLRFEMRYEGATPTLELISKLLSSQANLEVLDLTGSYIHTNDLPSFVHIVIFGHPSLQKLLLSSTNVGDHTATLLFRALAGDTSCSIQAAARRNTVGLQPQSLAAAASVTTSPRLVPKLKHLELSSKEYMQGTLGSMGVSSFCELLECLPFMQSLETLVLQHLIFHRRYSQEPSTTFMLRRIFFLDVLYQRFNLLQDRLPSALWPILGYVEEESSSGVAAAPYFSKRKSVWNQLLLAGFAMTSTDDEGGGRIRVLVSQLLPDWKECWQKQEIPEQQGFETRPSSSAMLYDAWKDCSFHFSKAQQQRQENSFKASALFLITKEHLVMRSSLGKQERPPGEFKPKKPKTLATQSSRILRNQRQERAWALP